jgi:hypothetical protein
MTNAITKRRQLPLNPAAQFLRLILMLTAPNPPSTKSAAL